MSKVPNMSKICQNGKDTQTSCKDNHSNHKTIINTHKHLMSCQSHRVMCLLLDMRLLEVPTDQGSRGPCQVDPACQKPCRPASRPGDLIDNPSDPGRP
jgi:hypothetical protein